LSITVITPPFSSVSKVSYFMARIPSPVGSAQQDGMSLLGFKVWETFAATPANCNPGGNRCPI
jgi:hypothetical protein